MSFSARLVVDREGQEPCREDADWSLDDDCYDPNEPPVVVFGDRPTEFSELESLVERMEREEEALRLPRGMAAFALVPGPQTAAETRRQQPTHAGGAR